MSLKTSNNVYKACAEYVQCAVKSLWHDRIKDVVKNLLKCL